MRKCLLILLVLPSMSAGEETVIHRCAQADGTVAFQETPCAAPDDDSTDDDQSTSSAPAPEDEFFDFVNPFDEPQETATLSEPVQPPSQDRAECEKTTRDAIDEIDFEMRKGYTEEQGQQHLAQLLELTRQLRACKQL